MVNVSAVWTPADAAAGGTPMLISKVLEICPNAMPSAPSTSWAAKPIKTKVRRRDGSANSDSKMAPSTPDKSARDAEPWTRPQAKLIGAASDRLAFRAAHT